MNEKYEYTALKALLMERGNTFPIKGGMLKPVRGKTLYKGGNWWKAIVLVKDTRFEEKYQLRFYGWRKVNGEYKVKQKFNISATQYLGDIVRILQVFAKESGKEESLYRLYEEFYSEIDRLEMEKRRLEKQRSKIPEMRKKLNKLKKLLEEGANEREMQRFLRSNVWIFGTEYKAISQKEKEITIKSKYDFLLKRYDGFVDILELKSPTAKLFVSARGNKKEMSKDLKEAISQVMQYLAEARTSYLFIKEQTKIDLYFPKAIIVIGRRNDKEKDLLRIHNEFLHNIEIKTYDDLIDTGQKVIKTYKLLKNR